MTFGTEFWSAISGALVGGLIALVVQLVAIWAAKKERKAAKKERSIALAHSIMFKVMRIHSNLYNLHLHLEESFAAVDPASHNRPCLFVLPLVGTPADVDFSAEEMSLVLSFKDAELTDMLMSLDGIHNNLIEVFETYAGLRNELQASLPAEMEGNVGTSKLTKEEWMLAEPKMVVMNQLLVDARTRAKLDYDDSKKATDSLLKAINDTLGLKLVVEFKAEKLAALAEAIKVNTE